MWFHSTSIFQRLFFCYLLECAAIYFQCYAFHGRQYIVHFMKHQTGTTIEHFNGIHQEPVFSLFREEISACATVHTHYVVDACDRVRSIILLSPMMGTSFVLDAPTRLIVSELRH